MPSAVLASLSAVFLVLLDDLSNDSGSLVMK